MDGKRIINKWSEGKPWTKTGTVSKYLKKGVHKVKVEYFDRKSGREVKVFWAPKNNFAGQYYNNTSFEGTPKVVRNDGLYTDPDWQLYKDWAGNRPASGVNKDDFAVRWTGAFEFDKGYYDFVTHRDDGMRVWVDDYSIFSKWDPTDASSDISRKYMTKGWHIIRAEYVEFDGAALAGLKWAKPENDVFTVSSGTLSDKGKKERTTFITRQEPDVKNGEYSFVHNWGTGSPDVIPRDDNFWRIWEGNFEFDDAPYLFRIYADDSMKLSVDGALIFENPSCCREYQEIVFMDEGFHKIHADFAENDGDAVAKLYWKKAEKNKFYKYYYKNKELHGNWSEDDVINASSISEDWTTGSPYDQKNDFSIRYIGVFDFEESCYGLSARIVDKKRVFCPRRN